jgi:hypothetical protein
MIAGLKPCSWYAQHGTTPRLCIAFPRDSLHPLRRCFEPAPCFLALPDCWCIAFWLPFHSFILLRRRCNRCAKCGREQKEVLTLSKPRRAARIGAKHRTHARYTATEAAYLVACLAHGQLANLGLSRIRAALAQFVSLACVVAPQVDDQNCVTIPCIATNMQNVLFCAALPCHVSALKLSRHRPERGREP